jgi:hypothetical protein
LNCLNCNSKLENKNHSFKDFSNTIIGYWCESCFKIFNCANRKYCQYSYDCMKKHTCLAQKQLSKIKNKNAYTYNLQKKR